MAETKNGFEDDGGTVLKLNAKDLIEFFTSHTKADKDSFDRLLKWFWIAASVLVGIAGILAVYEGIKTAHDVTAIRAEATTQIQAEVTKETSQENIQKYISAAIEKKTDAQFKDAIARSVAAQLQTPERQKFLETAVQQQVDIWFAKHQKILQTAAQHEVEALTKRFQQRETIQQFSDKGRTSSAQSGPAVTQLRTMAKALPDENLRLAASVAVEAVAQYWSNTSYLLASYEIKGLNGKTISQSSLTTCNLLELLKSSPSWETRARSADLLWRNEKGVPEALMDAISGDDYVDVRIHASKTFSEVTGRLGDIPTLPDPQFLREWWAKEGPGITAKLKPLSCK